MRFEETARDNNQQSNRGNKSIATTSNNKTSNKGSNQSTNKGETSQQNKSPSVNENNLQSPQTRDNKKIRIPGETTLAMRDAHLEKGEIEVNGSVIEQLKKIVNQ